MKYRKKPVVIEAFKFVGYFKGVAGEPYVPWWAFDGLDTGVLTFDSQDDLYVNTLEGKMLVSIGDYIIKGIQGELYPCKPDIFEATYELAEYNFSRNYHPASNGLTFGEALEALKDGKSVSRKGWNGNDQFVYLIKGTDLQRGLKYGYGEYEGEPTLVSTLAIKTASNQIQVGWLATQSDMLSNDWQIVE